MTNGAVDRTDEEWVVYQSTITAVGAQVQSFVDAGILVLFGTAAPRELHDISVLHEPELAIAGPRAGDSIEIGDRRVLVLAAGNLVETSLLDLGHASLKADGRTEAKLPGDVCVPVGSLVRPEVGQSLRIVRPAPDPLGSLAG